MKLNDFVSSPASGVPLNVDFLTKSRGDTGATPTIGVEGVINPWLYQQISNRAYILQFLYALTMSVSELRSPILVIRNEVFRKGFEWVSAYTKKCKGCGRGFDYPPEKCDKCGGEEFTDPDASQKERGNAFIKRCNSYNQGLKDLLRQLSLDLNICLVPGTSILTKKRIPAFCPIEDIKVGDFVYTHKGRCRKVTKIYTRDVDESLTVLYLNNKEIIKLTRNHPVYTTKGWVKAGELTTDHILFKFGEVSNSYPRFSNTLKRLATRESKKLFGVEYHGSKGHVSPKKGLTFVEYYGDTKAEEISNAHRETSTRKGVNVGNGFYFRAKRGTFTGENNPNWRGGTSRLPHSFSFSKTLKESIRKEFNNVCALCSKTQEEHRKLWNRALDVHHMDFNKQNTDRDNLVPLCKPCHAWVTANELRLDDLDRRVLNGTKICKIAREWYKGSVYNLEVEEDNSYVGKGIIYHNCDDAYIALVKEYFDDGNDNIRSRVTEFRRIHPALIEFDVDSYGRILNRHWTCYFHRDVIIANFGKCPECGRDMVPLMYHYSPMLAGAGVGLSMGISTQEPAGQERYFLPSEIIKKSKFNTSEVYGMSPIFTIFEKVMTLIGMDKMLYKYFWERKVPSSMILTTTDDPESLRRERDYVRAEMKKDPDMIPWIGVSQRTGRGRTEMIRLFHTLQEMDYIPVKQEIRERIAALYGVSPIWQGATEAKGGLVSQTSELVVTSRAVEHEQQIFNDMLDSMCDELGITDWRLRLRQPEEKAEATRLQFILQRVQAAQTAAAMGFDVKLTPGTKLLDEATFEISGEATKQDAGGMGGFPGMMSDEDKEWAMKAGYLNWVLLGGTGSGRKSPGFRPDQEKTLDAEAPGTKEILQPKVSKNKKSKVVSKKTKEDTSEDTDDGEDEE